MILKRCEMCNGRKIARGFGGIEKKCTNCNGTGYNEDIEDAVFEEVIEKVNFEVELDKLQNQIDQIDQLIVDMPAPVSEVNSIYARSKIKKEKMKHGSH